MMTSSVSPCPSARWVCAHGLPVPDGVRILPLCDHADERGVFRELFRESWTSDDRPVQWNMVRSNANVLRGVHAHRRHLDYLTVAAGEMILALHDLRPASPTFEISAMLRLEGDDPHLVVVPAGVAHGFYFPAQTLHIYGVSEAFDGSDELGCRWDDPALGLSWPCTKPVLSARDRGAGSYEMLVEALSAPKAAPL